MEDIYLGNPNLKKANVAQEFTQEQIEEFMRCAADPVYFAKNHVKIVSLDEGLVGFKPSSDLISTRGVLPLSTTFDTVGSICKTVKDTQILYNILSDSKKMFLFESRKKIKIGSSKIKPEDSTEALSKPI